MFIDKAKVDLYAGKGGDGMISFRREKYVPFGGPSGGNGGRGGSIYFVATKNQNTLISYRHAPKIQGVDGGKGKIKEMYGRNAEDIFLEVPVGTVILDRKTDKVIKDLSEDNEKFLIAEGGRGGRGNMAFASSINKAPKIAENGLPGEIREVYLELKLLADVGLVGLPSVGKSTFLSVVTASKPEIAPYPFTTLIPNLGVTLLPDGSSFVIADLPGLIEGASVGKGLGFTFLRHIERCRVIIHMLDLEKDGDPLEDFDVINKELASYNLRLKDRPMLVVCNKMDADGASEKFDRIKKALEPQYKVFLTSTLENKGLTEVLYAANELLAKTEAFPLYDDDDLGAEEVVDSRLLEEKIFYIVKSNAHRFVIQGDRVLRTYGLINHQTEDGVLKLISYLRKIGVEKELKNMGAEDGDTIVLNDFEFEFYN